MTQYLVERNVNMKTPRSTSADTVPIFSYKVYAGDQEIQIPPAYAQQYQFSLFRIGKDEHIVISNIQYRVLSKEFVDREVKVNVVLFANPAEPGPGSRESNTSKPDSTEKHHHNEPMIVKAGLESVLWYSEQEGSYIRVADIYKLPIGTGKVFINRVRHLNFTETRFSVALITQSI